MSHEPEKMSVLKKYINSWQHFGINMLLSKAWEKAFVDSHRYRIGASRHLPSFRAFPVEQISAPESVQSKGMTILFFLHYFFPDKQGGTERFTLNLARAQMSQGNRVCIITLGKRQLHEYEHCHGNIFWTEFEYEGVPVVQFRHRRAPRGLYYGELDPDNTEMYEFSLFLLERYHPDIVHLTYPQPFLNVAKACEQKGVPIVITLTDFCLICHYASMINIKGEYCSGSETGKKCRECRTYEVKDPFCRYRSAKWLLFKAAAITTPSAFVSNVYKSEFPGVSVKIIPHGISPAFVSLYPSRRKRTSRFLYAGTLSPLKGVHVLIQAFRDLKGDVKLDIVGNGDRAYCAKLKMLAGSDSRISFHDGVAPDQMPEVYGTSDCIVIPSLWYETYNFSLREAVSCGCLAVCSNIGAMPEAIVPGKNGYLFEPGNVRSLRDALELAKSFDWTEYAPVGFPSIEDEAVKYSYLYQNITARGCAD